MTAAVLALSAAVLAHEVCLLRVLAVADWHHAATLVVSVALLGFGASGTLLALVPRLRSPVGVAAGAALHAVLLHLAPRAADAARFNVLEVGWEPSQWLRLLAVQGVYFLPFLAAGVAIGAALSLEARRPGRVYGGNLLGSGIGAAAAPFLLALGPPEEVLRWVALGSAASALLVPRRLGPALGVAAGALVLLVPPHALPMSPFKALPSAPGKEVLETRHGPMGRVDRASVPSLHHAPGLSLLADALPERQEALFVDGHLVAAIDRGRSAYLDHTLGAFPFAMLGRKPRTLLLGVGADLARADRVVEADADLLDASGAPGVASDPRAHLRETGERYDVVVHHVSDLHPVAETPLLTVEGLSLALERTTPDGMVAISCAVSTPPRAALKLLATADRVTPHVTAVRSADRLCVALRRRASTPEERQRLVAFCDAHAFDPVRPSDLVPSAPRHLASTSLVPPGPDYPYDVTPATDARPYFHKSFRWSRLPDFLDRDRIPFVQWGYVALLVALVQVTLLSLLLTVLPLATARASRSPALTFAALGLAYMLLEMAYLQRAMLRIGSPVHAAAVVIGGFLVGSGLGSLAGERLGRPLRRAALAAAALAPIGYLAFPSSTLGAALLCAAVAFPMGIPFPAALARLSPPSVPWALAWNGCASVFAASAAPLLSSTAGILATALAAGALYAGVALAGGPNPPAAIAHP